MLTEIAKWTVFLFGLFIILCGFLMLFKPQKARTILRLFASTNLINYTEITLRMLIGIAIIIYSAFCKHPSLFNVFGWFLFVTAIILFLVPRKIHHRFSLKSAEIIKPSYFRLISPFAFLFGGFIIYSLNLI